MQLHGSDADEEQSGGLSIRGTAGHHLRNAKLGRGEAYPASSVGRRSGEASSLR